MKSLRTVNIVLGLLVLVVLAVFFWPKKTAPPPSVSELEQPPVALPKAEPEIRYPLPEPPPPAEGTEAPTIPPLPALGESDAFTSELLTQLFGEPSRKLLTSQHFLRRLVLIIDALPREDLPMRHLPVRSPLGSFETVGEAGEKIIATANFNRYASYVALAEAVPPRRLAEAYLHIYPLLEESYRELGHAESYFHDRMIAVLDHLLATPQVKGPIPVVEHISRFRYADPQLESLSAGQKILLRIGPENARRLKKVMQQLRDLLAGTETAT